MRKGTRAEVGRACMTYPEDACSYRRAEYTEEEEENQRRSSVCSHNPLARRGIAPALHVSEAHGGLFGVPRFAVLGGLAWGGWLIWVDWRVEVG